MRYGNKGTSRDIFKAMQSSKDPVEGSGNIQEGIQQKDDVQKSLEVAFNPSVNNNLGAAASMRNRGREEVLVESIDSNEVIHSKPVSIKKKINFDLFENHVFESIKNSVNRDDYYEALSSLYSLFLDGGLSRYSIEGLDKNALLEVLEEFKGSIEDSLK